MPTPTRPTPAWPTPEADAFALAVAETCGRVQAERDALLALVRKVADQYESEQNNIVSGYIKLSHNRTWQHIDHETGQQARALLARIEGARTQRLAPLTDPRANDQ